MAKVKGVRGQPIPVWTGLFAAISTAFCAGGYIGKYITLYQAGRSDSFYWIAASGWVALTAFWCFKVLESAKHHSE
jgi:hypothetical protein